MSNRIDRESSEDVFTFESTSPVRRFGFKANVYERGFHTRRGQTHGQDDRRKQHRRNNKRQDKV